MKKLIAFSCAIACIFASSAAHAQALKIGTVDMEKIFKQYYKTKDAEVRINEARTSAKKELDDRVGAYKDTMDQIKQLNDQLQNPGLSDAKRQDITKTREEKINEFKNLDREIQDFRAQREKDLQDEAIRMRNDIVTDIMGAIKTKIQSENYDYVFDRSGPSLDGVPVVVFARDSVDFSDEIIKTLNNNKKTTSSTPSSTPAPAPATTKTPKPDKGLNP